MSTFNCENRRDCTAIAFVISLIIGIITAFLQITGVITLTAIFSIVAFGIAVLYLAVTLIAAALSHGISCSSACVPTSGLLLGILGTIISAVILLAVGFAATSVIGAIVVGILFFSFSLLISSTACLIKCLANCNA